MASFVLSVSTFVDAILRVLLFGRMLSRCAISIFKFCVSSFPSYLIEMSRFYFACAFKLLFCKVVFLAQLVEILVFRWVELSVPCRRAIVSEAGD